MTEPMSTDALELYCRNRAGSTGELTEYDRLLLMDVSDRLCALQAENAEKDKEIKRLQLQRPIQVDGDVMALDLELAETKAVLSCVEAERDAAMKELNGLCWCCKHGKKWDGAPVWSKATTCEYMKERGVLAIGGGKSNCDHWEWHGVQEVE